MNKTTPGNSQVGDPSKNLAKNRLQILLSRIRFMLLLGSLILGVCFFIWNKKSKSLDSARTTPLSELTSNGNRVQVLSAPLNQASICEETIQSLLRPLGLSLQTHNSHLAQVIERDKCQWTQARIEAGTLKKTVLISDQILLSSLEDGLQAEIQILCGKRSLETKISRHGEMTWRVEWKADHWDTECMPEVAKIEGPKFSGSFASQGLVVIDPTLTGGFKGEAQVDFQRLLLNGKFIAQGGGGILDLRDYRILLRKPILLGSELEREPASLPEKTELRSFSILLNGEILLPHIPYGESGWRLRGKIRFPAQTQLEETGFPSDFSQAYQPARQSYLFSLKGSLGHPEWSALQK
ncbi:MAG: hypothetical protein ACO3A2_08860 [Bdellovibrionia bacterium]